MKKFTFTLFCVIILSTCSSDESTLELFSAEAFAYSIDNGWELNATCLVKGFEQKEEENEFKAKLSFTVDLKTPDGNMLKGVGGGLIDKTDKEKITDLLLETQIQLDSSYKTGKYTIMFNVDDNFSGKSTSIQKEFELTN
ncbi:MAG: hypothetical protein AB1432_13045 [Bacteroidota bacterium]|jgi:hypothetical protein